MSVTFLTVNQVQMTYAVDLTVVSPFRGSLAGVPEVNFKGGASDIPKDFHNKRANTRREQKVTKYKDTCTKKGVAFVPFVINSTGKIHRDGVLFLTKLANHASEVRGLSATTLLKYYYKLLNVALIKQVARVICLKSLESVSPASYAIGGMDHQIRTGNARALELTNPQLAVYRDPRADY